MGTLKAAAAPASKPVGGSFDVIFVNRRPQPVQLFWMTPNETAVTTPPSSPAKQSANERDPVPSGKSPMAIKPPAPWATSA